MMAATFTMYTNRADLLGVNYGKRKARKPSPNGND